MKIALKRAICLLGLIATINVSAEPTQNNIKMLGHFNLSHDLFLAQFDSKTDVDDIHTIAAVATMLRHPDFSEVNYHAVAGAYGIQEGLYVPAPKLFDLAFGEHWSNAHKQHEKSLNTVIKLVQDTLTKGGDIWIAEAGQSDFSAKLVAKIHSSMSHINTQKRIHIVQHSDWNQNETSPNSLAFVKNNTDYHKIADGNAINNGTPGFKTDNNALWKIAEKNPNVSKLWQLAKDIGNKYNGQEGRYNNESISNGGLDFSDTTEACWIFGYNDLKDSNDFFNTFIKVN